MEPNKGTKTCMTEQALSPIELSSLTLFDYCRFHTGNGICDTGFSNAAKTVVFRSLGMDYVDERAINRSANGNISGEVLYTNVKCSGKEKDFTECTYDFNKTRSHHTNNNNIYHIFKHNDNNNDNNTCS
uniref:Uncharacterized protein n=1 Tax=Magallana gigas TaxID=29159 RepID=K1PHR1_MAGGI